MQMRRHTANPHSFCAPAQSLQGQVARQYFDPDMVVTRSATGQPVSRYGDDSWDFKAQSMDGVSAQTLYFWRSPSDSKVAPLANRIREQNKALIWAIADRGDLKTFHALLIHNQLARHWSALAYEEGVDLFTWFNNISELGEIFDGLNSGELYAARGIVRTLWRYRKEFLGSSSLVQRDKIIERIKESEAKIPEGRQTPLIPSRVYCSILASLVDGLDEIELEIDEVLDALRNFVSARATIEKMVPRASPQQAATARKELLADTADLMRSLGWSNSPGATLYSFIQNKLVTFQCHLMYTVVAFSGMRVGEARILPLEGVSGTFQHRGRVHYLIKGYTRKLHRGAKKQTEWVTSEQGHRAIQLAIRISQTILSLRGLRPVKGQKALLFPSTQNPYRMVGSRILSSRQATLAKTICPEVTTEDLDELNLLELERDWDRSGISVGKKWPLAMHQLRRSLSVYAHRSGMVSLPALKAQLQHITHEMRAYYADGWSRAVNLVFEKEHFSHEWNAAKTESTYFGLTGALGIAFDDGDELLGIGAKRISDIVTGRSRSETLALIKSGTIAYRETVLGGCVSTSECKVMPLDPINFECVTSNCVNLVARSKRLDFVIRSQESAVALLERDQNGSAEHRLEAEQLKNMLLARDRLRQAQITNETKG